jgi:hypothetical protein
MSANIKQFNNRLIGSFDIGTGYGALGDCVQIVVAGNFSIDPLNNAIGLNQLFSAYIIQTNLTINVTLPALSQLSSGWNSKFYFTSTSGKVTLLDSNANVVAVLNPQFSATLINAYGTWKAVFHIPSGQQQSSLIGYDTSGFPLIRSIAFSQFYGRTSTASSLNLLTPVPIVWNTSTVDPLTYSLSGSQITLLLTGKYIIDALVGINTLLGGLLTNMQFRIRRNGSLFDPTYANAGSISIGPSAYYDVKSSNVYNAGTIIELVGNKTILNIIGDTVIDTTATWISIRYLP